MKRMREGSPFFLLNYTHHCLVLFRRPQTPSGNRHPTEVLGVLGQVA